MPTGLQQRTDAGEYVGSAFLQGGGELGALIRSHDWSRTPLGTPTRWPQSLKTAVQIMLASRQPFGWGGEPSSPISTTIRTSPLSAASIRGRWASRPPRSGARSGTTSVRMPTTRCEKRQGTYVEAQLLIMERHGYPEETYYTFSYSPIPNDQGSTGGLICANTDDTRRVIGERQLRVASRAGGATTDATPARRGVRAGNRRACARTRRDLPFACIYISGDDGSTSARLATSHRRASAAPSAVALDAIGRAVARGDGARTRARGRAVAAPAERRLARAAFARGDSADRGLRRSGRAGGARRRPQSVSGFRRELRGLSRASSRGRSRPPSPRRGPTRTNAGVPRRSPSSIEPRPLSSPTSATSSARRLRSCWVRWRTRSGAGSTAERCTAGGLAVAHRNGDAPAEARQHAARLLAHRSRPDRGRLRARRPRRAHADLASTFRSAIEQAGLRLSIECAPLPTPVYVDRDMWEKIVLNLVSNAFKFTLRRRDRGLGCATTATQPCWRCATRAAAFPTDELPRLFERFHRVDGRAGPHASKAPASASRWCTSW